MLTKKNYIRRGDNVDQKKTIQGEETMLTKIYIIYIYI